MFSSATETPESNDNDDDTDTEGQQGEEEEEEEERKRRKAKFAKDIDDNMEIFVQGFTSLQNLQTGSFWVRERMGPLHASINFISYHIHIR